MQETPNGRIDTHGETNFTICFGGNEASALEHKETDNNKAGVAIDVRKTLLPSCERNLQNKWANNGNTPQNRQTNQ